MPCTEWSVPREWEGETCFILAGGESLKGFDASVLRGRGRVIAIKEAGLTMAPWADVLYWADAFWCDGDSTRKENGSRLYLHKGKYKITRATCRRTGSHDVKRLLSDQRMALSEDPTRLAGICSGGNCINLAALFGAKRIVLLGYDMGGVNWDGRPRKAHKDNGTTYRTRFMPSIGKMAAPLQQRGVAVINANPESRLDCFPKMTLEEILAKEPETKTSTAPKTAAAKPEDKDAPAPEAAENAAGDAAGAADDQAAPAAAKPAPAEPDPAPAKAKAKAEPKLKTVEKLLEQQANPHEAVSAIMGMARKGDCMVRIRLRGPDVVLSRDPSWWALQLRSHYQSVIENVEGAGVAVFECRNPRA